MANPQLEEGSTSIANEILCELCKISFNGTELKVIICIFRYTFGFHRKSHKLSASFIAKWINCDSRSVKRALKTLQEKKIIICINSDQRGVTSELMFNKDYEQWVTDDKAVTSDKVVTGDKVVPRPVTEPSPEPVTELSHKKRNKRNKNIKEKYYDDFFEKRPRRARYLRPFLEDGYIYSKALHGNGATSFNRTWTSSTERVALQGL